MSDSTSSAGERPFKLVADNRKARHDYFIDETVEAGIVLVGTEVKSLRAGRVNLRDSYAEVRGGQVYLNGVHISAYEQGNIWNHEPIRSRKLLLHKREIDRLAGKVREKGYTLVPTRMYFRGSHAKVELGLARGKKSYDKRDTIAKRDADREMQRVFKGRQRGDE
jgi:SsrA-binding protein